MKFEIYKSSRQSKQPHKNAVATTKLTKRGFEKAWSIKVNTLEELIDLVNQVECKIVIGKDSEDEMPYIEIYDTYRE